MSAHEHSEVHHSNQQSTTTNAGRSATSSGILSLVLTGAALLSAPVLLLIPYIGFLPALIAAAGAVIASLGLRGSYRGKKGAAVTGLIVAVAVFALLAGIATVWNLGVVDPAIRDYDELREVIDHIRQLIFG